MFVLMVLLRTGGGGSTIDTQKWIDADGFGRQQQQITLCRVALKLEVVSARHGS